MQVSVTDAKAQLTDLVRRAEAGEEIVLTRHGTPAVRLVSASRVVADELPQAAAKPRGFSDHGVAFQGYRYDEKGTWDAFFDAPGIDIGRCEQPPLQVRDSF